MKLIDPFANLKTQPDDNTTQNSANNSYQVNNNNVQNPSQASNANFNRKDIMTTVEPLNELISLTQSVHNITR